MSDKYDATNAVFHAITKANYTLIDSAKDYENEEFVGLGIRKSKIKRESLFVVSKLFSTKVGRKGTITEIEDSLKKFDIGYLDQYLLHCPQGGRVLECYDVLLEYQKKGLIKTVGVSNFGINHLEAMKNSGRPLPQVNQIELHPWCTNEDVVKWCQNNNVVLVGYSPLAEGQKLNHQYVIELSKKYKKTPAQILIRWSLQKSYVTIPKSIKPFRIDENADVFDFSLSEKEINTFDGFGRTVKENVCWDPLNNDMETEFGPTK